MTAVQSTIERRGDGGPDPRWTAVLQRDPGAVVFAVRSTGTCCRAACPDRPLTNEPAVRRSLTT